MESSTLKKLEAKYLILIDEYTNAIKTKRKNIKNEAKITKLEIDEKIESHCKLLDLNIEMHKDKLKKEVLDKLISKYTNKDLIKNYKKELESLNETNKEIEASEKVQIGKQLTRKLDRILNVSKDRIYTVKQEFDSKPFTKIEKIGEVLFIS